jgi:hypothetical protein
MMRVAAKPDFFAQKSFFEKMMAGSNPAIIYAYVMHRHLFLILNMELLLNVLGNNFSVEQVDDPVGVVRIVR